jgi:hypothetical protein
VNTYIKNQQVNGAPVADPSDPNVLEEFYTGDITSLGIIRLPVCSPEIAFTAWDTPGASNLPNYPCVTVGPSECGTSSFTGATTDASPLVTDCQKIISNIGSQGTWEVENFIEQQHQLVQFGTCAFGVKGTTINGNVNFSVGSQDIVDLINLSIQMFTSNGKVGAGGDMQCKGDVKQQDVSWGIYHN